MNSHGTLARTAYTLQPGHSIHIKSDGTAEGTAEYVCDKENVLALPHLGSPHPDDSSLIAHDINITFLTLKTVRAVYSYIGITANYSDDNTTIEFDGGCDQVPIQTHPDFESFAGTPEDPENGAMWVDRTTGETTKKSGNEEFKGFGKGDFAGCEYYLVTRPVVTKTYYRKTPPDQREAMTVVKKIPGVPGMPGITNWLCLGSSYRKTGSIYQVTEQFKGSPKPGWNKKIYK